MNAIEQTLYCSSFWRETVGIVLIIVPGDNAAFENSPRDSLKLEISTRRLRKENNPDVTQRCFQNGFHCAGKGEVFRKDNDNDDNVAKKAVLRYESGVIRNSRYDLQVGEIVSSLKGGRLDAGNFIFPEIQMLQLRQFLKKAVRFDLVQFIVAQQSGAGRNTCRTKSRLSYRQNMYAYSRCKCMYSLLLNNVKKRAKLVLSVRYSITCFRLPAEQFIRYRVITMRRSINFANCALE